MGTKQRIQARLTENPETSNRAIGAELNVNDKLVGRIRNELEKKEQIPVVTHTRGLDGRLHPRKKNGKKPQQKDDSNILRFTRSRYPAERTHTPNNRSILGQLRTTFTGHPLAFIVALPFGGFVPIAVWCLTHLETLEWWHWTLVAGGALFSSLTVIEWGITILDNTAKAIGFAILVEGVMLASQTEWLSLAVYSY